MHMEKGRIRDWLVVLLLMAALILSFVDRIGLSLLVDPIRADLGISDAEIGLLQGIAFGLFFAVMGLPLGWLADRWSRKGTIMLGVGMWSVATAACGLAANFPQLLLARIGVGAGEAGLAPASYSIVHDRFPREQLGRAISLFQVGGVLGAGLALLITGYAYRYFTGGGGADLPLIGGLRPWQQTFLAIATPGLLFLILIAAIREPERVAGPADGAGTGEPRGFAAMVAAVRSRIGLYLPLFVGMSGVIMTSYALVSWMPAVLGREFHWPAEVIGVRYGLVVLSASPVGLLAGGWLADALLRSGSGNAHVRVVALAALLGLPFALALALPSGPMGLLLVVGGLHFAASMPMGVVPAFLQLATPPAARAQVSGLYVLFINVVGLGLGPTLVGLLSTGMGPDAASLRLSMALVIGPAMLAAAAVLAWLARSTGHGFAADVRPAYGS
ncbi:MFS transporter [Sphingomonas sp. C8-2]|nr:MFS transporter [Sphingomonas sp. C8-2]